jgi:hypothetical protein
MRFGPLPCGSGPRLFFLRVLFAEFFAGAFAR